jgi:hypothetical protein
MSLYVIRLLPLSRFSILNIFPRSRKRFSADYFCRNNIVSPPTTSAETTSILNKQIPKGRLPRHTGSTMFSPTGLGDSILDLHIWHYLQECAPRQKQEGYTRLEWLDHVEKQVRRGLLHRKYHMSPEAFAKLVDLLRPNARSRPHQAWFT